MPDFGLLQVQSRAAGSVERILVNEGSSVHGGDALMEIAGAQDSATVGDTQRAIIAQLKAQKERLTSDLIDVRALATRQLVDLDAQSEVLTKQVAEIDGQVVLERRQVKDLSALLERLTALGSKGYASAVDIQQQRTQELDAEAQIKALTRQRLELTQQIEGITGQIAQLPMSTSAKVSDLERQRSQAEQSIAQNELERATVVRAPHGGVVSSLVVAAGQAVIPQQQLLSIMPEGAHLEAQLWVPSKAVGFIKKGTQVALHYQPFPYQKFGVAYGEVQAISSSALAPNEVAFLSGGQPPQEAMYRVQVTLPSQTVEAFGEARRLTPGMQVDADLVLERRRMFEWLLEPIYALGHRMHGANASHE